MLDGVPNRGSLGGHGTSTAFAEAHTTTRCLASVRYAPGGRTCGARLAIVVG